MKPFSLLLIMFFAVRLAAQDLAITHAKVYPSPEEAPLEDMTIVIRAGKIAAIEKHPDVPNATPRLDCKGCVVFAGFWNCHVHFTETKWSNPAVQPAMQLTENLQKMLTHSGFTTVVDTGSDPRDTTILRKRINEGEVLGPHIYTAGFPLYPVHGIPYYLSNLPAQVRAQLGQPATPAEAEAFVQHNLEYGADLIKLFTGSYVTRRQVKTMSLSIADSAVSTTHREGHLVFTHPSNAEGFKIAIESGVDVFAHAPDTTGGISERLLAQAISRNMAMIPTLKLFSKNANIAEIRRIVSKFHRGGGQLLFGSDIGFLQDYDLAEEYRQLTLAGLSFSDVLTMLTVAPAKRFLVSNHLGSVAVGMSGDLTILSADPALEGFGAFTKVRYTIRSGRILYQAKPESQANYNGKGDGELSPLRTVR